MWNGERMVPENSKSVWVIEMNGELGRLLGNQLCRPEAPSNGTSEKKDPENIFFFFFFLSFFFSFFLSFSLVCLARNWNRIDSNVYANDFSRRWANGGAAAKQQPENGEWPPSGRLSVVDLFDRLVYFAAVVRFFLLLFFLNPGFPAKK